MKVTGSGVDITPGQREGKGRERWNGYREKGGGYQGKEKRFCVVTLIAKRDNRVVIPSICRSLTGIIGQAVPSKIPEQRGKPLLEQESESDPCT